MAECIPYLRRKCGQLVGLNFQPPFAVVDFGEGKIAFISSEGVEKLTSHLGHWRAFTYVDIGGSLSLVCVRLPKEDPTSPEERSKFLLATWKETLDRLGGRDEPVR